PTTPHMHIAHRKRHPMATVQDRDIHREAKLALQHVTLRPADVSDSEEDTKIASFKPGFAFEIVGVQHFVGAVTAEASYDVKIGTTSALAAAAEPAAATRG